MPTTENNELQTVQQAISTADKWLSSERFVSELNRALPSVGITGDRMVRMILTEMRANPKLAQCSIQSVMGGVMVAAPMGLEFGPGGYCWLIPRWSGKKGCNEAAFQMGYKGLLNLAWRSDKLSSLICEVVYEHDTFSYSLGIPPVLTHIPADTDRGEWTHVYAALKVKGGEWLAPKVMSKSEIIDHRDQYSESYASALKYNNTRSPWHTNEIQMAQKTVLMRALNFSPMSTELAGAISLDLQGEQGIEQNLTSPFPLEMEAAATDAEYEESNPSGAGPNDDYQPEGATS